MPLNFSNIKCILLVVENEDVIEKRLFLRNEINVLSENIVSISMVEKEYSQFVAEKLGVYFYQVNSSNENQVNILINQMELICRI